jgi:hypothetical protein
MSRENEMQKELLKTGGGPAGAPRKTVDEVMRVEQRRLRLWGAATVALWVLGAASVFVSVLFYLTYLHPKLRVLLSHPAEPSLPDHYAILMPFISDWMLITSVVALALMVLAAVCTVLFVVKSRHATLRQIRVSLAEISEQIKTLPR